MVFALACLGGAIYMVSSALIGFDRVPVTPVARAFRVVVGFTLISGAGGVQAAALAVVVGLAAWRRWNDRQGPAADEERVT